ncbi:DUF7351 domain-containing protein [Halalkalicoccus tibetensis]|uniref:DUF7351 domain-containing protein n=1 Tax=Halalkalicoccus tibetensis TaxID=175632 RepID=A0ABD5V617_9EURY
MAVVTHARHFPLYSLEYVLPLGLSVIDHPAVLRFHEDHGVDLTTRFWELEWCYNPEYITIRSESPLDVVVSIPLDDNRLMVVIDETLTVRVEWIEAETIEDFTP